MLDCRSRPLTTRWTLSALAGVACLGAAAPSQALLINDFTPFQQGETNPNENLLNTGPPPGDRGFSNVPTNRSGVYLGDHWVLSARHVGPNGGSIDIAGETFPLIPNSVRQLTNANGSGSDLILWRVGVNDQGLSPEDVSPSLRNNLRENAETGRLELPIADRLPTFGENSGEILTLFGRGRTRVLNTSNPQVNAQGTVTSQTTFFDDTGVIVSGPVPGSFEGFQISLDPSNQVHFGENRRSSGNFTIQGGIVAPTTGFTTTFNRNGLPNEAQSVAGDSGGPVFREDDNGDWVLVGVQHANFFPSTASVPNPFDPDIGRLLGAFGARTGISDLSSDIYFDQIADLRAEVEYSVLGDINLDGVVEASLVGDGATGDLGILVENWQRTFETADIQSWIAGDLNQDAVVDLADFALLRAATGGQISVAQLQTALAAVVAIPEPTTLSLVVIGFLAGARRRTR